MSDHACLLEQECPRCEGTGYIDDEDVSSVTNLPDSRCEECDRSGILTIDETDSDEHETCEYCRDGYLPETCGRCGTELVESSYFGTPRGNEATYRAESSEITCADCAPTRVNCPDCSGEGEREVTAETINVIDPETGERTERRIRRNGCSCCGYSFDGALARRRGREADETPSHIVLEARIIDSDGIYMPLLCVEWTIEPDGSVSGSGGCWSDVERAAPDNPRQERLDILREIMPGEEDDAIASDMADGEAGL